MMKKIFQLEPLICPSCSAKIEGMLKKTEGIGESEVLFNSSRVKVSFDESKIKADAIKEKIEKLGFDVLGIK